MDETANLSLAYIAPQQAQKFITHNEALRDLDTLVQLSVLDRDLATPPGSPSAGDRYLVATSPTGAWSGPDEPDRSRPAGPGDRRGAGGVRRRAVRRAAAGAAPAAPVGGGPHGGAARRRRLCTMRRKE